MRATGGVTLDLRGLAVPLPVARTAVAIARLRSGELIEVLTTDLGRSRSLGLGQSHRQPTHRATEGHDFYRFVLKR